VSTDYSSKHRQNSALRHPGTGQWLIDSADFNQLKNRFNQSLFCPGHLGTGKTILTSLVIDHLTKHFGKFKGTALAYVYCVSPLEQVQTAESLLGSILKQFIQTCPGVPEEIDSLFNTLKGKNRQPRSTDVFKALLYTIKTYSRTFIIVDALDELQSCEQKKFLEVVFGLQKSSNVNIFVTSRYNPYIENRFKHAMCLPIRATGEDISLYARESLGQISKFLDQQSSQFKERIANIISDASDGM
jgi:Cdc6-like AAA superfamily ATPase